MPPPEIVAEIGRTVDTAELERGVMAEGIEKFAEPERALLRLIAQKRSRSWRHEPRSRSS
jgi:transaldolase